LPCSTDCTSVADPSSRGGTWCIRGSRPGCLHPVGGLGLFLQAAADGTRQIVDFQIPGDFLGLRSVLLRTSDHSFEPIVDIEAAEVLTSDLLDAFAQTPRLATAILWAASRDEAMVVEHLVGIGRRDAEARMAHFLLELGSRLRWSAWATGTGTTARSRSITSPMRWG
jgi:hypothetical protein